MASNHTETSDDLSWTIDELIARYELEPGLKDVFVEGTFDQEIGGAYLKATGNSDTIIYTIDSVSIDGKLLRRHGLTSGNRQRVIALAIELSVVADANYICLIDSDFDHWTKHGVEITRLRRTKFCDIETHFLEKRFVQELVIEAGRAKIDRFDEFYESFLSILFFSYIFRLTGYELDWKLDHLGIEDYVVKGESMIGIDEADYVKRTLMKNSKMKFQATFLEKLSQWRVAVNGDPKLRVRGHDFTALCASAIRLFRGVRSIADATVVERMILLLAKRESHILDGIFAD